MSWKSKVGDTFTIVVIIFVIVIVVFTIVAYINESFVKADAEQFLAGTNATNVTWGVYPDGYYDNNSYPILQQQDEKEHQKESSEWSEKGWTKLK